MNESFNYFINVLRNKKPEFILRYDAPQLQFELDGPTKLYMNHLLFWDSQQYKQYMDKALDSHTFEIKIEFSLKNIGKEFLKSIIDELSETLSSFHYITYNKQKRLTQKQTSIYFLEPLTRRDYEFDEIEKRFKQEILDYAEIKHKTITKFVNSLEDILYSELSPADQALQKNKHPKKSNSSKDNRDSRVYSLSEIAEMFHVTKRTVYNWKDNGVLPFTQIGSKTYLTQEQLNEFLEQHEIKPITYSKKK